MHLDYELKKSITEAAAVSTRTIFSSRPQFDWANRPWRVGNKLGRTIYVQMHAEPSDHDPLVGFAENKALAALIVFDHNAAIAVSKLNIVMRQDRGTS